MKLKYLDRCLPDYFQGSSLPVMALPIDSTTTYTDLRDAIIEDYNTDSGLYPDDLPIEKMANDLFSSVWSGAWHGVSMNTAIDNTLEDNDSDSVYVYLAITE